MLRRLSAAAVVGGPLCYLVGGALSPVAHTTGARTIAANATANPVTNTIHLVAFILASYLLPVGAAALAWLAWPRSPRLAAVGGVLGVAGWLPFSALTALDALAAIMAQSPRSTTDPALYDRFAYGAVMNTYLLVYVVGHLLAYVLIGLALRRAGVVPPWASWAIVASSPLLIAAFVLPSDLGGAGTAVAVASVVLMIIGSAPAAATLWASPYPPRSVPGLAPVTDPKVEGGHADSD